MAVTRCHLPAMRAAETLPRDAEAFRAYLASLPENCPNTDCTPGLGCRAAVRDLLRCAWMRKSK